MKKTRSIIAVSRCRADELAGLQAVDASHVVLSDATPWSAIEIQVPARLTISEKMDSGVRLYNAQLVFRTCEEPGEHGRWVYRCLTADGSYILIGTDGRPFPVTTVTDNHPDNMTDSQLFEMTASFSSARKVQYINV